MKLSAPMVAIILSLTALAVGHEPGYRPLFDGKSLDGWEGGGQPAEKCWKADEGMVVCTGDKGPWLRSKEQFDDFNLRLEYKLKRGGNSGLSIRVAANG